METSPATRVSPHLDLPVQVAQIQTVLEEFGPLGGISWVTVNCWLRGYEGSPTTTAESVGDSTSQGHFPDRGCNALLLPGSKSKVFIAALPALHGLG
jgi:hypothetical protein